MKRPPSPSVTGTRSATHPACNGSLRNGSLRNGSLRNGSLRNGSRRNGSRREGAAAIELATTLPLLLALFLGACDFGRFGHVHSAVINAARTGAGQGILNRPTPTTQSAWEAAIRRAVANELAGTKTFDEDLLSVSSTCVTESDGMRRVSVQVTYQFNTMVTWGLIPSQIALRQTAVLRML